MSARAHVTGFAWLAPPTGTKPREGWVELPAPTREELDPRGEDARFPKLDRASRLLALAATRALGGRTIAGDGAALVLASVTGSLEADERFEATRALEGGASPLLFPATLATAPAAELAIRLGLRGPTLFVSAGGASLVAAVGVALSWLAAGEATLVLACGLEVASRAAGNILGVGGPFAESAACLVLETARPPGRALGRVEKVAAGAAPVEPDEKNASLLGNRGAPAFAAALANRRETVVSIRDGHGFAGAARLFFTSG